MSIAEVQEINGVEYQESYGYTLDSIVNSYLPLIGVDSETRYGHSRSKLKDIVIGIINRRYLRCNGEREIGEIARIIPDTNLHNVVFFQQHEVIQIAKYLCTFPREDKTLLTKYINNQNKFRAANNLSLIEPVSLEMILDNLRKIPAQSFLMRKEQIEA